jgi:hypothetical protein
MANNLSAPVIGPLASYTKGIPQDQALQRHSTALKKIEDFGRDAARAYAALDRRINALTGSTSTANGPTATWFELTPAATVEVDPSAGTRQILTPDQATTINLVTGYGDDDTLFLVIQQGATPYAITFQAAWKVDDSFRPIMTANTYTSYTFQFKAGIPYLQGLPIQGQL